MITISKLKCLITINNKPDDYTPCRRSIVIDAMQGSGIK